MTKAKTRKKAAAPIELLEYDVVNYFGDRTDMAGYLDALLIEGPDDAEIFAHGLGDVSRAIGMTEVARKTGLGRESLYKSLHEDGNPSFATILKVLSAFGMQFRVVAR
jgi:probable addiction module antidote protein